MLTWSGIVGLDAARQALLLLAVDPSLAGVAFAATVGSGKSTLARAFAQLLPAGTPFVELPVGITEDRLLGGLDFEATLAAGARVMQPGVLAQAHGGILYVDGINLLDESISTPLMDVLGQGELRLEREGLSATLPARFVLIGTYDRSDGELRNGLLDRIGLIVPFEPAGEARTRAEVIRRNIAVAHNDDSDIEAEMLAAMIQSAREQLAATAIRDEQLRALAQVAGDLGVEGNRADVFAAKAAIAHAALSGRDEVDDEDLRLATRLVLLPRATRIPQAEETPAQKPSQPPQSAPPPEANDEDERDADEQPEREDEPTPEAMLLSAIATDLPADVLNLPFTAQRKGKSGSRGGQLNHRRGKWVRSVHGVPAGNRLALTPTILAAAPWQPMRRGMSPQQPQSTSRTLIQKQDLRIKLFRDKAGTLFVFIVDASGSMALNRMRQAKGAVAQLLQSAYVHRDQVALVAFRGKEAQLLLAPSQSVERAKRELDVLPTGGGTPLAQALLLAWQTARQARAKDMLNGTLVVMTDGRANVPLTPATVTAGSPSAGAIEQEVQKIAGLIAGDRINTIVIDTQANYLSRGEAVKLARWLNGRYVYLPNARSEQIVQAVAN